MFCSDFTSPLYQLDLYVHVYVYVVRHQYHEYVLQDILLCTVYLYIPYYKHVIFICSITDEHSKPPSRVNRPIFLCDGHCTYHNVICASNFRCAWHSPLANNALHSTSNYVDENDKYYSTKIEVSSSII